MEKRGGWRNFSTMEVEEGLRDSRINVHGSPIQNTDLRIPANFVFTYGKI